MLSPNGMNLVTDSCGARVTVTVNEQLADWPAAALLAAQPTYVVPTGNSAPDAGVQNVVMGGVPPVATGPCQVTVTGCPAGEIAACAVGQTSVSCAGGGGVGSVGLSPHAARARVAPNARTHEPARLHGRIC
jgi:hypothetical protein